MLTFKAEILKNKQKSDGTYNVKIRMTYNREVKRLATNIFVRQEDLTKSFKLKESQVHPRSRCHSKALSRGMHQTAN